MKRHSHGAALAAWVLAAIAGGTAIAAQDGWTIPPAAETDQNPMAGASDAVRKGKEVYQARCQRCHGADGSGKGPEADPLAPPANLAKLDMTANPDGVIFYKVWNGHTPTPARKGKMPAFKTQLVRDDVWRVVEYVKTIAKPAAGT